MSTVYDIPDDIVQKIKAYVPKDRDMRSPTANCIHLILQNYAWEFEIGQEDINENDGDVMCLTISHFRRWVFEAVLSDRLMRAWLR